MSELKKLLKNLMAKQTEETDTNVNVYSTNTSKYLYVCVGGGGRVLKR